MKSLANTDRSRMWLLLAAFLIAIVFSIVAAGTNVLPGDVAITRFIQRAPEPPAQTFADIGNWLGSAAGCIVVTAIVATILFAIRRPWDASFAIIAIALHPLNGLLKLIIESPRPTDDLVQVSRLVRGYGFPSGHAMGATLTFGAIAIIAHRSISTSWARRSTELACVLVVLLVGFGRVYTGAHWPSDVIGGYLWGAIVLALLAMVFAALRNRNRVVR